MKNLLIYLVMLILTFSLNAKSVEVSNGSNPQENTTSRVLDKPWHLVASRDSLSSTVNLTWSMPSTNQGLPSFEDNFNSTEYNNHNFKTGWTVIQGNGFAYDHEDADPDVGYWFRTYYYLSDYHPWWGNGNTSVPSNATGNGHARVNWGNNIDSYLTTPEIAVNSSTKIVFDWAGGYDYNVPEDHGNFMVMISLDNGLNWETIWHWDNIAQWNMWMPVLETTINLNNYAGHTVRVAFRFQQNDGTFLLMDNVKIANSTNPAGTVVIWDPNNKNDISGTSNSVINDYNNLKNSESIKNAKESLTGYKVFRDNVQINEITSPSIKSYTDLGVANGTHSYKVVAAYGTQESDASAPAQVTVNTTDTWLYYGSTTGYKQHFSRNMQESWRAAVDFDLPANNGSGWKAKKLITATYTALEVPWKIVPFETIPAETPFENLSGTINTIEHSWNDIFVTYYDATKVINNSPILNGHIAVVLDMPAIIPCETQQNALNCQEMNFQGNPNGLNSWYQKTPSEPWMNLDYLNLGAWNIRLLVENLSGITEEILPGRTELAQNYPNPFNPNTTIGFYNTTSGKVDLTVYNAKGEVVANLINSNNMKAGYQSVNFNAIGLNSGVYYYTLTTSTKSITKKMLLVK